MPMRIARICGLLLGTAAFICSGAVQTVSVNSGSQQTNERMFIVSGVVKELKPDGTTVVIRHQPITNYMDAMTMPFKARDPKELVDLQAGDAVSFRLRVTETESCVDQIRRTARATIERADRIPGPSTTVPPRPRHPLLDYPFVNELGKQVRLSDFQGQALAITFFFTRCPIPDYCPRLSRNFEEASQKLASLPGAATNWHFLSVSFDTDFDTPPVLKAYGERYQYDPSHWSFLTGPKDKIAELASLSDSKFDPDSGFFNHNFRTLIIDATGHLQTVFPIGGNLSEAIVAEMLKAAAVTNRMQSRALAQREVKNGLARP
jgi:protein SCO1